MLSSWAVPAAATAVLLASAPAIASPLQVSVATSLAGLQLPVESAAAAEPAWNCSIQAWVRAPDLRPNVVLPADARLVANGTDCGDIRQWDVGLRLKERAYVKLRAAEVVLPEAPEYNSTEQEAFYETRQQSRNSNGLFEVESWLLSDDSMESPFDIARKAYYQALQNRSLWEGFAAERIAFDSRITLDKLEGEDTEFPMYSIRSFQLAVPNVNLPFTKSRSNMQYWLDDVSEESGAEQALEFYAAITLKNGTTLDYPAAKALFLPEFTATVTSKKEVYKTIVQAAPYSPWDPYELEADKTFDNSTHFEITLMMPNRQRIFEAGSTTILPVSIKRLNGTQQPTSVSAYATSHTTHTWAASFARSPEQADTLSKSKPHIPFDWQSPMLVKDSSAALNTTLDGEALEKMKKRDEETRGIYRQCWFDDIYRDDIYRANKTDLNPLLEEQTVLVNFTLPERLFPTTNTTFTSIVSSIHFRIHTSAPVNQTDLAFKNYPLLSDLEDDQAWVAHPDQHIKKLVSHFDSQAGKAAGGRLTFSGNTSITVVPANATSSSPSSPSPISYLSSSALSPMLLPLTTAPVELANLPFPLMNHTLHPEGVAADGSDLVKKRYSDEYERWDSKVGGKREWAGRLWARKIAREKEYKAREEKLAAETVEFEQSQLVVQA